jgi:tetratricopeptide (TPR) repeat protein
MRYGIISEIAILIIFLVTVPAVMLIEHNIAISDEAKETESAIAYQQKGDQLYSQGKFNDASVQYWEGVKRDPKLEDAHFKLAEIYYENLWNYDALNELNKLEKLNRNYPELYLLIGRIYNNRIADPDKASKNFQRVIASDPKNSEAYYYLGTIYQQQNKQKEALVMYEKAVSVTNPSDLESVAKSYLQLGRIYKDQDLDKATEMLKKGLTIVPKSEELISELTGVYSQKAETYKSEQKFDEAAKIYEEIVKMDPINPVNIEFYMELGSIYRDEELYDKAIKAYNAITKIDPTILDVFSALKELYMLKDGSIKE